MESLFPALFSGISTGSLYALVGMGLVAIYKTTRILNFAQGILLVMGAYIFFTFFINFELPLWISLLLTGLASAAFGAIIFYLFARPLMGQPVFATIIMTLGLGLLLQGITYAIWGTGPLGTVTLFPKVSFGIGNYQMMIDEVAVIVICIVSFAALLLWFKYSRMGIQMRACAENEQAAESIAIDVRKVFLIAWIIGVVVSAAVGIMLSEKTYFHSHIISIGWKCLAVLFLGGLESFGGVLIAGLIIGIAEVLAAIYLDPFIAGGGTREVFAFVLVIVILMFKPYGFGGQEEIKRV